MLPSDADLKAAMSLKSDQELCDVLYGHRNDYEPNAIAAAQEEFNRRNLTPQTVGELRASVERDVEMERAPLGWGLRIVAFFVSTLAMGIPVMLAHSHYVELGAYRKARDWKHWAAFGFLFYVCLFVVSRLFGEV